MYSCANILLALNITHVTLREESPTDFVYAINLLTENSFILNK